jgi:O-methyltransferase
MSAQNPRYSLASRILRRFPRGREALWAAYSWTPYPISRLVLAAGRSRFLFPDNRRPYFHAVFEHVRDHNVPGDYLEFGVYKGQSFIMAFELGRDLDMRFYAFDSFEGIPRDEGQWKRGEFRADQSSFLRSIRKAGVDLERVVVVPGFYDSLSLSRVPRLKRAAIVHIDSDLYSSARDALRLVADVIGNGTVLIFDDWFSFADDPNPERHGEQRAFWEWKEAHRFAPFDEAAPWHKSFVCMG